MGLSEFRSSPKAMKVSFSLKSKAAAASSSKPVGDAPSLKKPVAFASLEDDEPVDAAVTAIAGSSSSVPANKRLIAQNVGMSKALQRQIEEEKKVDATVFEYDEVYDKMQEAKARQKAAKEVDSKERKVRLIWTFNGLVFLFLRTSRNTSMDSLHLRRRVDSTI